MTAPKGSTKVLTGVKKTTTNTAAANLTHKSAVSSKQRSDSRSEVKGVRGVDKGLAMGRRKYYEVKGA